MNMEHPNFTIPTSTEDLDQEVQELLPSLPKEEGWLSSGICLYQGFWCPEYLLRNVICFQRYFQPHDQDIILVSFPKCGTTWLKTLIFSIVNRSRYTSSNTPLLTTPPHKLVPFLEIDLFDKKELPVDLIGTTPSISPRLFSTHIPYSSLPESIKKCNCRVVYICRNPLDVVVSWFHFTEEKPEKLDEEHFESFFKGQVAFGPFWDHVLGYWKESLEKPHKTSFFMYEDLKGDIVSNLKRLAEFIGYPFSVEEEKRGVIQEIADLCSLKKIKDLEVNKSGRYLENYANNSFFRKGEVGDWANYLSSTKMQRLEKQMQEKLSGSGLTFKMS
ncbi:Flavonol 4'-sulfotransferase [Salix suchowensis]|nr:Flavonol 4'-sulfotransferase [Salix suchowensis]